MAPWLSVDTQVWVSMPRSQVSRSSVGTMRREMKDTVFLKYVLEWKTCGLQQWGRFEFGCSWISYVLAGKAWLIMCVSLMLQSVPCYPQLCSVCLLHLGIQHEGSPFSRKDYCCSREKSNGKNMQCFQSFGQWWRGWALTLQSEQVGRCLQTWNTLHREVKGGSVRKEEPWQRAMEYLYTESSLNDL